MAPIQETLKFFYKYKTSVKTDYLAGAGRFPIVSTKLKDILINIEQEFLEFFPVQLICERTNNIDSSYFLMNIVHNVACFDWEQSEYKT